MNASAPAADLAPPLIDGWGRRLRSARISLLDRCDLRCTYCMPAAGLPGLGAPRDALGPEDWVFFAQGLRRVGVRRLRLTGGEPLLYRGLLPLVRALKEEAEVVDLALTTNGTQLARLARPLRAAGLDRINISIDSLDPARFARVTRRGALGPVWAGLEAAIEAGFSPMRVNCLLLPGFDRQELARWLEVVAALPLDVRFLERMPIGEAGVAPEDGEAPRATEVRGWIPDGLGLRPEDAGCGNGPAVYERAPGWAGRIGWITPLSRPYCDTCGRLRVSAQGALRPCLSSEHQVPLADAIRARDPVALEAGLRAAAAGKARGHHWLEGGRTPSQMSALGG